MEEKTRILLLKINHNIVNGNVFIFAGILILIQYLTLSRTFFETFYFILSTMGIWAIFIALIISENKFHKKELEWKKKQV